MTTAPSKEWFFWLPIDTAPKDGTEVLLYVPTFKEGRRVTLGHFETRVHVRNGATDYEYDQWSFAGARSYWPPPVRHEPSHWMALPGEPSEPTGYWVAWVGAAPKASDPPPFAAGLPLPEGFKVEAPLNDELKAELDRRDRSLFEKVITELNRRDRVRETQGARHG